VSEWLLAESVPPTQVVFGIFSAFWHACPPNASAERKKPVKLIRRKYSTQLDNNILAAMTHERPDVLYAKRVGGELGALEEDDSLGFPS
jgi:hypothetical protein